MADSTGTSALHFSGGEKEVIERKLNVSTGVLGTGKDIEDFYEISRCMNVIKSRRFKKVSDFVPGTSFYF